MSTCLRGSGSAPGIAAIAASCFLITSSCGWGNTPVARIFDAETIEGDDGSASLDFRVELSAPAELPVTLYYETGAPGDTATPGSDYQATASSITIASGETSGSISVPVMGDFSPEDEEFLTLRVHRAEGAFVLANRVAQQTLHGPEERSDFGSDVSLSGDELAAGAYFDRGPNGEVGSIYFYLRTETGQWEPTGRWFHSSGGRFGRGLSLDGDQLLVRNEQTVEFYDRAAGNEWIKRWHAAIGYFLITQLSGGCAIYPSLSDTEIRLHPDVTEPPPGAGQLLTGNIAGEATILFFPHLRKDRLIGLAETHTESGDPIGREIQIFEPANPDGSWRRQAAIAPPEGFWFEVVAQAASTIFAVDQESGNILVFVPEQTDPSQWTHVQTLPGITEFRGWAATQIAASDDYLAMSAVIQVPSGLWEARFLNYFRTGSEPDSWDLVTETTLEDIHLLGAPSTHVLSVNGTTAAMASAYFGPNGGVFVFTPELATGMILPDERPYISVGGTRVREKATESSAAEFEVFLDQAATGDLSVDYRTVDGSAIAGKDYVFSEGTLNFAIGEVSKSVSVAILPDDEIEEEETFEIRLSNESKGNIIIGSATATIEDLEPPLPIIPVLTIPEKVEITEGQSGSKILPIELVLDPPATRAVTVFYSLRPKSEALNGADVDLTPGTVSFAPGETTKSLELTVYGDSEAERDETLELRIDSEDAQVRGGWGRSQQLQSGERNDGFGLSLALAASGESLLAGAPYHHAAAENQFELGKAYLYQRVGSDWIWKKTFEDPAPGPGKQFGKNVAIWEDTIAISTRADETWDRHILIYKRDQGGAGNWGMVARIETTAGAIDRLLLERDTLLVAIDAREFSVYSRNRGGPEKWGVVQDLTPKDGQFWTSAISQVVMRDGLIAISQAWDRTNDNAGSVHLFRKAAHDAGWHQIARLIPEEGSPVQWLGVRLAIDHRGRVLATDFQGRLFRYEQSEEDSTWRTETLPPLPQELLSSFGDDLLVWNRDEGVSLQRQDTSETWTLLASIDHFDEGIPERWFRTETFDHGIAVEIRERVSLYEPRFTGIAILDDDLTSTVSVSVSDASTIEGQTAGLEFLVFLSEPAPSIVSLDFTIEDGTAKASQGDYLWTSGSLIFNPGESVKAVSVDVPNDRVAEQTETLYLKLSNLSIGSFLNSSATGTIIDNGETFNFGKPTFIVPKSTAARYLIPNSGDIEEVWMMPDFDDSAWTSATTPVGYEIDLVEKDYEDIITTPIEGLFGVNTSMYLRIPFSEFDPERFETVLLKMRFDDGFVAYLNGTEIARANTTSGVQHWNSNAASNRPDLEALTFTEQTIIDDYARLIHPHGANILAIQCLNFNLASSDLLIEQELTGYTSESFSSWLEGFPDLPEHLRNPEGDFDQDGLGHLIEYALGLSPMAVDDLPLGWEISSRDAKAGPILEIFFETNSLPPDVEIRLEVSFSEDRIHWEAIGTAIAESPWNLLDSTAQLLGHAAGSRAKERFQLQPPAGAAAAYARLAVTLKE